MQPKEEKLLEEDYKFSWYWWSCKGLLNPRHFHKVKGTLVSGHRPARVHFMGPGSHNCKIGAWYAPLSWFKWEQHIWQIMQSDHKSKSDCAFPLVLLLSTKILSWLENNNIPMFMKAKSHIMKICWRKILKSYPWLKEWWLAQKPSW